MKRSELREYIKETIFNKLSEVTIEVPKNDSQAIKKATEFAEDDDVVSISEEDVSENFEPHFMYKDGDKVKANTEKDHLALKSKGYDHGPDEMSEDASKKKS
tara:strand:- start:1618 stop:1923 length:306 start_codon:yes stop_codon:yes gene_type:complete